MNLKLNTNRKAKHRLGFTCEGISVSFTGTPCYYYLRAAFVFAFNEQYTEFCYIRHIVRPQIVASATWNSPEIKQNVEIPSFSPKSSNSLDLDYNLIRNLQHNLGINLVINDCYMSQWHVYGSWRERNLPTTRLIFPHCYDFHYISTLFALIKGAGFTTIAKVNAQK